MRNIFDMYIDVKFLKVFVMFEDFLFFDFVFDSNLEEVEYEVEEVFGGKDGVVLMIIVNVCCVVNCKCESNLEEYRKFLECIN